MPHVAKDTDSQVGGDSAASFIIFSIFSALLLLSAIVWCVCCGTCFGRELWAAYRRKIAGQAQGSDDDEDEDESHQRLLREERAARRLDSFNEFIIEETELGIMTRGL
ncbi:hypothetical protein THASP1DRAFT_27990 [Thamnocephalis sphaerospora]|uniref:Uncharacterized protein n=1 Tax=Thamnocephalis sphaerospora TaxID=78915 RepID=A0A4P9XVB8_9FUNG|nr:hypothetical protein THASP1DRAFT_27990 [Thamnocephalis sphaerospora]|eukprot:RKP10224.1 hypothetical protein THASP1DRAFT_27990 [Thamnocephalis sphaerospora]